MLEIDYFNSNSDHKDAWVISFEIKESERGGYGDDKAAKVIELQRIRGGLFETFLACRFPWIEVGHSLDNYPVYLKAITGQDKTISKQDFLVLILQL